VSDSTANKIGVTLLQLTTPIGALCPQTRTLLGELAAATDPDHSPVRRGARRVRAR
jgi:hypothetical protein